MEFNVRQRKVITSSEPKILALSSAGAGKTSVLTERVRDLIVNKHVKSEDIVAITFTNLAAQEMSSRLGEIGQNVFIGTIHSYANLICALNGVSTLDAIADEDYDKIIKRALSVNRGHYIKVKHLLVDECQDISDLEGNFLLKIPAENFFLIGDEKQMIYEFKGSSFKFLKDIYDDDNFTKYYLTQNYRNAPNILRFAENFINENEKLGPIADPIKTEDGILEENITIEEALDALEESGDWGNWFILSRSNKEIDCISELLAEREIPFITFRKKELDLESVKQLVSSNKVKCLTIHAAKGLERSNVIVTGIATYNREERRIAYVAATRAENALYWCPSFRKRRKAGERKAIPSNIFQKSIRGIIDF